MDFNEFIRSGSERYPEFVTQKEMAAILTVCKSKAYAIQKQGHIAFSYINTAEGRRQQVKIADVLRYRYAYECYNEADGEFATVLRSYFEKQLKTYPPLLFVVDIRRFTGYAKTTVNNWIDWNLLKALSYGTQRIKSPQLGRGTIIAKTAFVDFLANPYYRNIKRKSNLHREQANEYEKLFVSFLAKRGVPNG